MEDKQEKRVRLLNEEVERLTSENEVLKKENAELQARINELSSYGNVEKDAIFNKYEEELKTEIANIKKLYSLYDQLLAKQKKYISKEKGKYKKATNKAISEFNKSIS